MHSVMDYHLYHEKYADANMRYLHNCLEIFSAIMIGNVTESLL
jgi:hypothetical protein